MRKLLCLIPLGLVLAAGAQQYKVTTMVTGATTNVVAADSLSNYTAGEFMVPVTKYDDVAVQIRFASIATCLSNVTFNFAWGPNSTTIAASKQFALTCAANSTTAVQITTNITVGNAGYFMLHSINAVHMDQDVTNIVIKVATKPTRRGGAREHP